MHGKSRLTKRIAGRKQVQGLCIAFVKRNNGFAAVYVLDQIVDRLDVVAFIGNKDAFLERKYPSGIVQYSLNHG